MDLHTPTGEMRGDGVDPRLDRPPSDRRDREQLRRNKTDSHASAPRFTSDLAATTMPASSQKYEMRSSAFIREPKRFDTSSAEVPAATPKPSAWMRRSFERRASDAACARINSRMIRKTPSAGRPISAATRRYVLCASIYSRCGV